MQIDSPTEGNTLLFGKETEMGGSMSEGKSSKEALIIRDDGWCLGLGNR